jgi:hypothetical protein
VIQSSEILRGEYFCGDKINSQYSEALCKGLQVSPEEIADGLEMFFIKVDPVLLFVGLEYSPAASVKNRGPWTREKGLI